VVALSAAAVLTQPRNEAIALVGAAEALTAFAFLFSLERLFPALRAVRVASAEESTLGVDARVMVVEVGGESRAYPLERVPRTGGS
jgi:hypothetical protein